MEKLYSLLSHINFTQYYKSQICLKWLNDLLRLNSKSKMLFMTVFNYTYNLLTGIQSLSRIDMMLSQHSVTSFNNVHSN